MTIRESLPFRFVVGPASYDTATVFYARLDTGIGSAGELLKAIYYLLWFPGYFGFNWDALSDCLRDLSWIPCKKVVLVHDALPKLTDFELKTYLEVLRDSVLDWDGDESHELEVVFQEHDKNRIEALLSA